MSDRLAEALAWADLCRPDNPTVEVGRMTQDQIETRCLDAIDTLADEVRANATEITRLREAFVTMERGYNLAAAVLDGAKDGGTHWEMNATESVPYRRILVRLAAWEAWKVKEKT